MRDDPTNADAADDERGSVHGDPVMAADTTPGERRERWFEPPEPPPPGSDRLTIEAYELEQFAYERQLQRR